MIVQCPECEKKYTLDDDRVGKGGVQVRCSSCRTVFAVPPSADDGAADAHAPAGEEQGKGGRGSVLVCDDAPFFRTMVKDILAAEGYSVELASSGEEALRKVAESRPDLLVLDIQLPDMNGFDVVKSIRSSEAWKNLPILAMSAVYTDSADVMNLQDIGADDYIGKKFKPEHLLRRVRNLIRPESEDL